jgi:anti-sigma factor RsiW
MDNFYSDERISSYLDGELSADEQARFEERLAENAELRQLVEELRALRGSLNLLPRYQLEPDFAERVLRRAEQRMARRPAGSLLAEMT